MRYAFVYFVLLCCNRFSRLFYTVQTRWVGDVPKDPWHPYRVVAILNHTSLMEFLFGGVVPDSFLRRMARHGVVPIAEKTIQRPLIGKFWRLIAGNVVSITRERDHTWHKVLESVDDDAMVIILPEGRMKRKGGLDKNGRPMTVRSGIGDLLWGVREGKVLLAYSQGLHHIQVPDESWFPKFFKPVRMRLESLDIATVREQLGADEEGMEVNRFKRRVVDLLTKHRDLYCTSDLGGTDKPEEWADVKGRDHVDPVPGRAA